jgi:prevent-host-death family protein
MTEISATDAARNFADLLDAVEHGGAHYTIVRRGRAVARIEPASKGSGADLKELLRSFHPDHEWRKDLRSVTDLLHPEPRP